jgi:long-chain acyl-CoA synthetase
MGLWIPPIFRAEVHFESRLVAPRLIETIHRERISVLAAVPRVFTLLKSHLETGHPRLSEQLAASKDIRAWKRWWRFRGVHHSFGFKFWALISGGGALPPAVEQFWNGLGFVVVQGYGMTETTALITLNHPFHVARGTIGKPLPGREVKIGPDGEVLVRGPMISTATWSGGELRKREGDWLATGDLAEKEPTGELRFLGRKSEVIVTGSGVNIHPEDLEAEIEEEPGVAACAVVPMDTPSGPEPCAVLVLRGNVDQAGAVIENANARLAEFQRVRRWMLWPEPDLPRTSTGKVRRKAVGAWLAETQRSANGSRPGVPSIASGDWLLALIVGITSETPPGNDEQLRLAEDLHLDSLGRVQLAAAIEEKTGRPPESGLLEQVQTLGQLRRLVTGQERNNVSGHEGSTVSGHDFSRAVIAAQSTRALVAEQAEADPAGFTVASKTASFAPGDESSRENVTATPERTLPPESHQRISRHHVYAHWPWWRPVQWIRSAFIELVMRPLVWFLANPRVVTPPALSAGVSQPILIVANHVTAYDGPLVQYALPGPLRRRIAIAMSGEMLDDFRHFRNPEQGPNYGRFFPFGPIAHFLVTTLFNVFPLPRLRDFQRSFSHAGEALDRGYHVLLFPEGARSATGEPARFRPGIGLLVKQSDTSVLPVAIRGLGALKQHRRGWFRAGAIELRIGQPIRFALDATESTITEQLQSEVKRLLEAD